jgi:hypothetical protein
MCHLGSLGCVYQRACACSCASLSALHTWQLLGAGTSVIWLLWYACTGRFPLSALAATDCAWVHVRLYTTCACITTCIALYGVTPYVMLVLQLLAANLPAASMLSEV